VGIALTMYGREEEADPLIDSLQVTNSQTTMSLHYILYTIILYTVNYIPSYYILYTIYYHTIYCILYTIILYTVCTICCIER